jgi:short subunit dehydrogenase
VLAISSSPHSISPKSKAPQPRTRAANSQNQSETRNGSRTTRQSGGCVGLYSWNRVGKALAAEGAKVVVNGRTEARVAAALDKIRQRVANAELRGVAADLGTANGVDAFLKQVTEADILVNNLGISQYRLVFLFSAIAGIATKFP